MNNKQIANTILQQLGGRQFIMMTGANNLVAIENGLRFRIGRNGTRTNVVKIVLKGDDTYRMQFIYQGREVNPGTILIKYADKGLSEQEYNDVVTKAIERAKKNAEPKVLQEYDGVYCDQLQELFTNYTKLYTRLF